MAGDRSIGSVIGGEFGGVDVFGSDSTGHS